jgi:hypothetical protein
VRVVHDEQDESWNTASSNARRPGRKDSTPNRRRAVRAIVAQSGRSAFLGTIVRTEQAACQPRTESSGRLLALDRASICSDPQAP